MAGLGQSPQAEAVWQVASAVGFVAYAQQALGDWLGQLLRDPTVAYLLLIVGLGALLLEIAYPGQLVPGAVGMTLSILGLFVLGSLPVNFAGLLLIFIAFALFVAEILAPGFGAFGVGGLLALLAGSLLLVQSPDPLAAVSPYAVLAVVGSTAGLFFFVIRTVAQVNRLPARNGREGLVGAIGEARTDLKPRGYVLVDGELWQAISLLGPVAANQRVQVDAVDGYRLIVFPVDDLV